jgi:acyl carrier protein
MSVPINRKERLVVARVAVSLGRETGMKTEVAQKLRSIVSETLEIDPDQLDGGTSLLELRADSLDLIELSMEIEQAFGLRIPDQDHQQLAKLDDAIRYIENAIAPR